MQMCSLQASVRTNDLLNAVHFMAVPLHPGSSKTASSEVSKLPNQGGFLALVGQQYYTLKETLIVDEQFLLRTIDFQIVVEHPHKYVLNFGRLIEAKHSLILLAVSILNDSIVYTKISMSHSPADIAAACIQFAGDLIGPTLQLPFLSTLSGWNAVGVSAQQVEAIGLALLDMTVVLAAEN